MVNVYMAIRTISVVIITIFGLLTLMTGILLATAPHGPGSGEAVALGLTKAEWNKLHEVFGFIAAGGVVLHVYSNYRALIFHFRRAFGLQRRIQRVRRP